MIDLAREIAQTLRNNRLRTALTGLSVAWGVFMLILLLGASRGVRNSFEDNWNSRQSGSIKIWSGITTLPYQGYQSGRYIELRGSDIEAIERDAPEVVESAIAYASVDSAKISTSRDVVSGGFEAVYPSSLASSPYDMKYGRYINEGDINDSRRTMVLSTANARQLFGADSLALGKTVTCLGLAWTVVGIYDHPWRTQSLVPYTTYKSVTGNSDNAYSITVNLKDVSTIEEGEAAEAAIRTSLAHAHSFDPSDNNAVWTWNSFNSYLQGVSAMGYFNIAMWVIGIFTLLTGIVGVSNIMFVSVRERTHEIGVRRAIGARPRAILTQILAESVAMTALFGYLGIVAGTLSLQLLNYILGDVDGFKNATVDISIAVEVTLALIVAGAVAGLFPALKALKVKPVEALRDE